MGAPRNPERPQDHSRRYDERRYHSGNPNPRYDERERGNGRGVERERDSYDRDNDRFLPRYTHGNSYDGTGRYGDRDPRPRRDYYD